MQNKQKSLELTAKFKYSDVFYYSQVSEMTFQCKKCKYKFSNKDPNKKDPPRICPWCNATNTVTTLKSADEIIRNVDDMLDI